MASGWPWGAGSQLMAHKGEGPASTDFVVRPASGVADQNFNRGLVEDIVHSVLCLLNEISQPEFGRKIGVALVHPGGWRQQLALNSCDGLR